MKVYLDIIFFINFIFDFIILIMTSLILRRNVKLYRIFLGSIIGSLTLLILFIRMNQFQLLIYKVVVSLLMVVVTFNYKNIRYLFKNIYYMYLVSIILGGFLTFVNNILSNYSEGFILINSNIKINIIISIILSVVLMFSYLKQIKELKTNYNKYYKVNIYFTNNENISFNAFLDTGNKLVDPYKKRPIILVKENKVKGKDKYLIVPYNTVNSNGILKCIKAKKIYIENIGYKKNFLIGLTNNINIDNVDCILNEKLLEG